MLENPAILSDVTPRSLRQVVAELRLRKTYTIDLPSENLKMTLGGGIELET